MSLVVVTAYDPEWPRTFERIRAHVWPAVRHAAMSIEHVGSTSVPGLRAKPVIDACIVVASRRDIPHVVKGLTKVGYLHRGDLGVPGREAFKTTGSTAEAPSLRKPSRQPQPEEPAGPARLPPCESRRRPRVWEPEGDAGQAVSRGHRQLHRGKDGIHPRHPPAGRPHQRRDRGNQGYQPAGESRAAFITVNGLNAPPDEQ